MTHDALLVLAPAPGSVLSSCGSSRRPKAQCASSRTEPIAKMAKKNGRKKSSSWLSASLSHAGGCPSAPLLLSFRFFRGSWTYFSPACTAAGRRSCTISRSVWVGRLMCVVCRRTNTRHAKPGSHTREVWHADARNKARQPRFYFKFAGRDITQTPAQPGSPAAAPRRASTARSQPCRSAAAPQAAVRRRPRPRRSTGAAASPPTTRRGHLRGAPRRRCPCSRGSRRAQRPRTPAVSPTAALPPPTPPPPPPPPLPPLPPLPPRRRHLRRHRRHHHRQRATRQRRASCRRGQAEQSAARSAASLRPRAPRPKAPTPRPPPPRRSRSPLRARTRGADGVQPSHRQPPRHRRARSCARRGRGRSTQAQQPPPPTPPPARDRGRARAPTRAAARTLPFDAR